MSKPLSKWHAFVAFMNQDLTPTRLNYKELAFFCRQLSFFVGAGISLTQLSQVPSSKKIEKTFDTLKQQVLAGSSLSTAMSQEQFPHLLCNMVQVGEHTGKLDLSLAKMEHHYDKAYETQRELLGVLMYPALLLMAMVGVAGMSLLYLLPSFALMFSVQGIPLPPLTQFLMDVSEWLQSPWSWMWMVVSWMAVWVPLKWGGFDGLFFSLSRRKGLARLLVSARMASVMSLMTGAGVPLMTSMDICVDLFKNKHCKTQLATARTQLATGHSLQDSFTQTGLFHPMFISLVKLGEETGNLTDALAKADSYFEKEKTIRLNQLKKTVEPTLTLVMGAVLLVIMLAIMLPTFSAIQVI